MATPATNFAFIIPDIGEANPTASSQVAGGAQSLAQQVDNHTHEPGADLGIPIQVAWLESDGSGDLDLASNAAILGVLYVTYTAVASASVADNSIFLDSADNRLKWKDGTGTVRTFDTTPPQP